jgi:hypothetical protein
VKKEPTNADRQRQALHALNCAIACLVAWPPSPERLGGAVYFTALALHRMAQADPDREAAGWAEKYLSKAQESENGVVAVTRENQP